MNIFRITIELDEDAQDPTTQECQWKVYTFGDNRIITDCDRSRFEDDDGNLTIGFLMEVGLAFGLRYSEHGISSYDLSHSTEDGLIIWEHSVDEIGATTYDGREKDAASFLTEYTDWANGQCFGYRVEHIKSAAPDFDPDDKSFNGAFWEETDACWGFIGHDVISEEVKRIVEDLLEEHPDATIIYKGEAAHVLDV